MSKRGKATQLYASCDGERKLGGADLREKFDSLRRGIAFALVGVLIWALGLLVALDEVGVPKDNLIQKASEAVDAQVIFPTAFNLLFLLVWLRYAAPRRVNAGQLRWFAAFALIALLVLVGYFLGRSHTENGISWEPLLPFWNSLLGHLLLALPAAAYFLRGRVISLAADKVTEDISAENEGVHLSFLYQIFAPSVLFCMSLFAMGVYGAAGLGYQPELIFSLFVLGLGTASFALLYWFAGRIGQGVVLYVPFIAVGLLVSFSASVVVDATWAKLLTVSIALTFALGVAEVSKRYGQIASGKLPEYEPKDADYFLLGANWSAAVFPAFTLVMISTFRDFGFILTGLVVSVFVVSWLHMAKETKQSKSGERFAVLYGLLLPLSVGAGIVWGGPANDWFGDGIQVSDVVLALLAQVAFAVGLLRLAKDTIGLPLDGFFADLWSPKNYLYRPHCLFLVLTVNSLIVILLLLLFVVVVLFPTFAGSVSSIIDLGKQLANSGFLVTFISLLALMGTFATPGSVSRLREERVNSKNNPTSENSISKRSLKHLSYLKLCFESGRPGISWIAGTAAATAAFSSSIGLTYEVASVFLVMTLITMFGFIVNDISDQEKDRIAGKCRPISTGALPADIATHIASIILGIAILLSLQFGPLAVVSVVSISAALMLYSSFSSAFPLLKGPYTAVLCVTPFMFSEAAVGFSTSNSMLAMVFLFVVFRELVLDAEDAVGDLAFGLNTVANLIGPNRARVIGWTGMIGVVLLGQVALENSYSIAILYLALAVLLVALWVYKGRGTLGIKITRVSMLLGICAAAIG